MFDETISHVAAAFIEVDGVWYAPAAELMELFAMYSSVVVGCMIAFLVGFAVFLFLAVEPVADFLLWAFRKLFSLIFK